MAAIGGYTPRREVNQPNIGVIEMDKIFKAAELKAATEYDKILVVYSLEQHNLNDAIKELEAIASTTKNIVNRKLAIECLQSLLKQSEKEAAKMDNQETLTAAKLELAYVALINSALAYKGDKATAKGLQRQVEMIAKDLSNSEFLRDYAKKALILLAAKDAGKLTFVNIG